MAYENFGQCEKSYKVYLYDNQRNALCILLAFILVSLVKCGAQTPPTLTALVDSAQSGDSAAVDQALDRIANTFKGIVVYKECTRSDGTQPFDIAFKGE